MSILLSRKDTKALKIRKVFLSSRALFIWDTYKHTDILYYNIIPISKFYKVINKNNFLNSYYVRHYIVRDSGIRSIALEKLCFNNKRENAQNLVTLSVISFSFQNILGHIVGSLCFLLTSVN